MDFVKGNYEYKSYSFKAKLSQASEDTKKRYEVIQNELLSYNKLKENESFKKVRIYKGRKVLGYLFFRGKKLCFSMALDPNDYLDHHYYFKNVGEKKWLNSTPMMFKLTSDRKTKNALKLFSILACKEGLCKVEKEYIKYDIPYLTTDELLAQKLIKIIKVYARISESEAESQMSNEEAMEMIQVQEGTKSSNEKTVKAIVNIDTLSRMFKANSIITVEELRKRKIIINKVNYVKVLARGKITKPLTIQLQEFSLTAVKMIVLSGGQAIKIK